MASFIKKFHPGVGKQALMILAGLLWFIVGIMLVRFALGWYHDYFGSGLIWYILAGVITGLIVHHLGFLRIVDKNLIRIHHIDHKYCLFGFMPWKSYILIAIMMTLGISLRNSSLPKIYLSVIYMGIGLALSLSSIRYFRIALFDKKKSHPN